MRNPRPEESVRIDGTDIVFGTRDHYYLPLAALDSPQAILQHAVHLCDKTWVTRNTVQQFIVLACSHYGFPSIGDIGRIP